MTKTAYIGFGSNLGDRGTTFHEALEALNRLPETLVKCRSRLYETEPEGLTDGAPSFLNAVVGLETSLRPQDLMAMIRRVELSLGKLPHHRSDMSRLIDLDLLLYGDEQLQQGELRIPHPRMHNRAFVLVPLAEIAPHVKHPVFECSISTLLKRLPSEDRGRVLPLQQGLGPMI